MIYRLFTALVGGPESSCIGIRLVIRLVLLLAVGIVQPDIRVAHELSGLL